MIKIIYEAASFNENDKEYHRIPIFMPFTRSNASYIFVQLGVNMINVDREDSSLKKDFIHRYVRANYQSSSLDFREYYLVSLRRHHRDIDLAKYLKSKLKTKEKIATVVHFLCGLAFTDGIIMSSERKYIDNFCLKLGVTLEEVSAIIHIYFDKQQKLNDEQKANSRNHTYSSQSSYTRVSLQKKYSVVLDIPENSDEKKIKSAYRKLAKKWHPDLMHNHSEAEQKYANDKFREIQEAYDYLNQN